MVPDLRGYDGMVPDLRGYDGMVPDFCGYDGMVLDLHLPMQSMPITAKGMTLIPICVEMCLIQLCIKFVSDLQ